MKRLIVVGDDSLIAEAIRIGLRDSGEFNVLGHVGGFDIDARTIIDAGPEVILVDDREQSDDALRIIRALKGLDPSVAVIVLTFSMELDWLDAIFDAGAAAAISKVTHPRSLGTLIRETVNGHVVNVPADAVRPLGRRPKARRGENGERRVEVTLTNRELEILQLVAGGSSNREIARNLWVTEQTVKFHLANVYRKLEVDNRTQASHYAHVNGLIDSHTSITGS